MVEMPRKCYGLDENKKQALGDENLFLYAECSEVLGPPHDQPCSIFEKRKGYQGTRRGEPKYILLDSWRSTNLRLMDSYADWIHVAETEDMPV